METDVASVVYIGCSIMCFDFQIKRKNGKYIIMHCNKIFYACRELGVAVDEG